jgi:ubiquinol-cytochrome c reductase iron-sulfur subunit
MAQHDDGGKDIAAASSAPEPGSSTSVGTAVVTRDKVQDPGLPPHRPRVTDLDPKAAKGAQRTIYTLFYLSLAGSIFAVAAYMAFPITEDISSVRANTLFIGLGMALALLGIGIAAVHWGKQLMSDHEGIDIRHATRSPEPVRSRAIEIFPLPAVVLFRGLGPQDENPVALLKETMWAEGVRLTLDPSGAPIRAADVTLGSAFHVIPDGLNDSEHKLEEKAKASVLLMRLKPEDLTVSAGRENWNYQGIVAYSKICTHVGCPVALYEQQTHHLLCPCHQSQFDIKHEAEVIFGPAKRPLPQLPITIDDEGYLVARSDFTEPVGPSFWER